MKRQNKVNVQGGAKKSENTQDTQDGPKQKWPKTAPRWPLGGGGSQQWLHVGPSKRSRQRSDEMRGRRQNAKVAEYQMGPI